MSDRGVVFAGFVYGQFATSKHIPCLSVDFGRQGVAFPRIPRHSTRSYQLAGRGDLRQKSGALDAQSECQTVRSGA
jgi:hypothetical protein